MIDTIYLENEISDHPRVRNVIDHFPQAVIIPCERYGEIFNRRSQDFRLQKQQPALLLARKHDGLVLTTPAGYGIGGTSNYYFSHMLNCIYDCRYCFLQGMYQSANYVVFVNYEDFADEMRRLAGEQSDTYFFSGYDCDSLAWDQVTGFVDYFLPVMESLPDAWLELRTKSVQVRALERHAVSEKVIVAFSLAPAAVTDTIEHKTPSLDSRLDAMVRLARLGWWIGLRFDPLIYFSEYQQAYQDLFRRVFETLPLEKIHSVSLGALRFPKAMFQKMVKLYPEAPVLAGPLLPERGLVSYESKLQSEMLHFCRNELQQWIATEKVFDTSDGELG